MEDNALEKIVNKKRMPVLFIGSGLSKRYLYGFPNWNELLEMAFKKVNTDPFQYQKYKDVLVRQGLSEFDINAKLGSIIENEFNEAFFDRKIKIGTSKNPTWVKNGVSPFKMYLSLYFKKMTLYKSDKTFAELQILKMLKNKVSAIITTNYDLFLENEIFPNDYQVFIHQNELFSADSYNIAEIYKIHGSATDANSIIISEKDYLNFNASRKLIIAKMLTLFAESPIVFLGYSFTDENIQAIIVEFLECLTAKELRDIDEHFIFIAHKKGEKSFRQIKRTLTTKGGNSIPITEIQTDNYLKVYEILNKITPGISPVRIRETKKIVKTIVDNSVIGKDAESVIVGIDELADLANSNKPLAIAIGYRESILNKFGYGLLADDLIFEDIMYNNKHFDVECMCFDRFASIQRTRLLPVFKYVKACKKPIIEGSLLCAYINSHNSLDLIVPKNIQKQLRSIPIINDYAELTRKMIEQPTINKKAGLLLKNIESFSTVQIRTLCKNFFESEREESMKSTNFKRCVMYLDLLENK